MHYMPERIKGFQHPSIENAYVKNTPVSRNREEKTLILESYCVSSANEQNDLGDILNDITCLKEYAKKYAGDFDFVEIRMH